YKDVGREKALADFTAGKPPWKDRDLYVFCFDAAGIITANGFLPGRVGAPNVPRGGDGEAGAKSGGGVASTQGSGRVEYRWMNPVTDQIEPKISFFQKLGNDVCGVGAYNAK